MKKLLLAAAALTAASVANAAVINEFESNDTLATANSLDGFFSLDYSPDIANSTTISHVTVNATAETGGFDFFKFTVTTNGTLGIFDIDYGQHQTHGFDPYLRIFDANLTELAANDDWPTSAGAGGSEHSYDSYLEYTFQTTGTYYVQVSSCCTQPFTAGSGEKNYQLHVSTVDGIAEVPEPAMLGLFGLGAIGLGLSRRRRA